MQKIFRLAPAFALGALAAAPAFAQLSQARQTPASATLNDVAYFAGGRFPGAVSSVVDAFDVATGTNAAGVLSLPRTDLAATAVGNFVIFAGGATSISSSTDRIDIYDSSVGPPSNPAAWSMWALTQPRFGIAATTVGTKAFFAGGGFGGPANVTGVSDRVDIYDASMGAPNNPAAWSFITLSVARGKISAAAAGDEAVFAGGLEFPSAASSAVDIYNVTTGAWGPGLPLSQARAIGQEGSAVVGPRIYFAGGPTGPMSVSDRIDIYDTSTGAWSTAMLPLARGFHAVAAVGNTLLVAGGVDPSNAVLDSVDRLNVITGDWDSAGPLSVGRLEPGAATAGGKVLFAGGATGGGVTAAVDVFEPYAGQSYCGPAVANSTGAPALLEVLGSAAAAANDVTLLASGMPASSFGFFITSQTQGFSTNPGGSNGNLCLGGAIGRYVGAGQVKNSGAGGWFELTLDLGLMPTPTGLVAAQAGQTWNFQAWHRDAIAGVAASNFTDAVSLTLL